jgi:hypothetical protein
MILGLALSGIAFGLLGAFCLCKAAAMEPPQRGIRVGGVKPFENDAINRRLALGLKAQTSNKNKRK